MTKLPNTDVKSYADRLINIETEIATLGQDKKELKEEAKASGVNIKALVAAVKIKMKERDLETEAVVNQYLGELGEQMYFAGI